MDTHGLEERVVIKGGYCYGQAERLYFLGQSFAEHENSLIFCCRRIHASADFWG